MDEEDRGKRYRMQSQKSGGVREEWWSEVELGISHETIETAVRRRFHESTWTSHLLLSTALLPSLAPVGKLFCTHGERLTALLTSALSVDVDP